MTSGTTIQTVDTPPGLGHAKWCLPRMAKLATIGAHSWPIHELACNITRGVRSKDVRGELGALYTWVRDNIRYRQDPVGNNLADVPLELIQSPATTIRIGAGDCAAMTTLLGSLCQTLGHRVTYRTVGPRPNAQAHVQMMAWDGLGWVHMDPVTEPMPATLAARPHELGNFGRYARGADHYWNQGGVMLKGLGFVPTKRDRRLITHPLGFVPSAQDRQLWQPTFLERLPTGQVKMHRNQLSGLQLGAGWTIQGMRVTTDDVFSLRHYMRAGSDFLSKAGKQADIEAYVKTNAAQINSDDMFAANTWTKISRNNRNWIHDHYGPPSGLEKAASGIVKTVAKVAGSVIKSPITKALFPVAAVANTKNPIQQAIVGVIPGGKALQSIENQVLSVAKKALPAGAKPVSAAAVAAATGGSASGGTLALDKASGRLVHYTFAGSPTISFSLGATRGKKVSVDGYKRGWPLQPRHRPPPVSVRGYRRGFPMLGDMASARSAAALAVNAVNSFAKSAGQPPQIAIAAVKNFQLADGSLKADGLWGNNSRAAAAYYLGVAVSSLPAVAKPWAGSAVTWRAPVAAPAPAPKPVVVAKPVAKPAAKPVVVAQSVSPLVTLAKAAVSAINTFRAKNKNVSPAVPVAQVRSFQTADKNVSADGLYGPATQAELAKVLGVSVSSLPPYNTSLVKKAAAPKPVVVKKAAAPAPKPVNTVELTNVQAAPKPVVVAKPKTVAKKVVAAKPAAKPVVVAKKVAKPAAATVVAKPVVVATTSTGQTVIVPQPSGATVQDIIDPWTRDDASRGDRPMMGNDKRWLIGLALYWAWQRNKKGRAA